MATILMLARASAEKKRAEIPRKVRMPSPTTEMIAAFHDVQRIQHAVFQLQIELLLQRAAGAAVRPAARRS